MVGHVRGVLVLLAAALMLALPLLGRVDDDDLVDAESQADKLQLGVRDTLYRTLEPLQRPLRIAQSWSLYGVGPNRVIRAEVLVDGVLRYRSGDPTHTWSKGFMRYRKVRPIVVNACRDTSPHSERLVQRLAARALAEDPEVRSVQFRCTASPWPGTGPFKELVSWTVEP